ncbi:hypothetical protein Tco_0044693 [Tanacetum coccineum]
MCAAPTRHNIALPFTPFFLASLMAWASKDSFNGISFSSAKGLRMSRGLAKIAVQYEAALTISSPSALPRAKAHFTKVLMAARRKPWLMSHLRSAIALTTCEGTAPRHTRY